MVEIAGGLGPARPVERDRPARAERPERAAAGGPAAAFPLVRGGRAVAPLSPTTAVYDREGRYPAPFLFQVARPKPPPPPFGEIFLRGDRFEAPPAVRGGLVGRFAARGPAEGTLLDARV